MPMPEKVYRIGSCSRITAIHCISGHLEKLSKATSEVYAKAKVYATVFLLGEGLTIHGLRQG